jgi:hypothetical protein
MDSHWLAMQVTGVDLICADLLQPLLQRLQGAVDLLVRTLRMLTAIWATAHRVAPA